MSDCGAGGANATDDTAALQACLDRCAAVFLPHGVYAVSGTLTVSNSAPVAVVAGADRLQDAFAGTGGFASSGTGSDAAMGAGTMHLLTLSTTLAGLRSGTVSVTASSLQAMNPTFSGTASTTVLDHAVGSFASAATTTSLTIDFGTLIRGGAGGSEAFAVFNRPATSGTAWTARLDLDGVSSPAPAGVFSTTLAPFANLLSGSSRPYAVSMATALTGTFSSLFTLTLSDEDLTGATAQQLALTARGSVIAPVAGDTNLDALIDVLDVASILDGGRYNSGHAADWAEGDFNADRIVDMLDMADFLSTGMFDQGDYRFRLGGQGQSIDWTDGGGATLGLMPAVSVPEPTTQLALWAAVGAMLRVVRWGRT